MPNILKDLFLSKKFVVAVLTAAGAFTAYKGWNVDPLGILTIVTPLLVYIGAQGWGTDAGKERAKIEQDTALKLAAMKANQEASVGNAFTEKPGDRLVKFPAGWLNSNENNKRVDDLMIEAYDSPASVKSSESGFFDLKLGALIVFALFLVVVVACASWKARTAAGVAAFIDCESPNLDAQLLADATSLGKAAVKAAISGDGHADTTQLKAAAAPLKSDLMRCGFAAAVAAWATPVPPQPGAPAAAGIEVDGPQLEAAFVSARTELGWAPAKLAGGKVL
jgi:hypothetical protein